MRPQTSRKPAGNAGFPNHTKVPERKGHAPKQILAQKPPDIYQAWPLGYGRRMTVTVSDPRSKKVLFQSELSAREIGSDLLQLPEITFSKKLLR